MFLVTPCDSLCTVVKLSGLTGCPLELLCWWMEDGALRCSFSLSHNVLPDSPNIFLRTVYVWAFKFVDYSTLLKFVVPVLGCHEECFYSVCTFEMYLYSLVAFFFNPSPGPCMYGTTMEMFLLLLVLVPLLLLLLLGWMSMELSSLLVWCLHSNILL